MQMNACGGAVSVMMVVITVVMAIVMVIAIVFVTCSPDYQATVPNAHDEETGHPRPIKVPLLRTWHQANLTLLQEGID